ncbi:hypothetical protein D2E76_23045 [Mycobacteroides abscessus]|uniref:Uncharacterized protein n=1 Tax=Mycobacteroides abscessus TaxID=36809 RepID=A0ABD7HI28_9MYCO|nr:hypothetical protein [Mycobacteroides abscessus]RIT32692.1 hypothetical protein D2E76_23045 [Mycobacteroides abscessus]
MSTSESENRPLTAEDIWEQTQGVDHRTAHALARRIGTKDEPGDKPLQLTPVLQDSGKPDMLVVMLRGEAQIDSHIIEYEEAAVIQLVEELTLSKDQVQQFGAEYILPYLLPYVESGIAAMCARVNVSAPAFPLFTFGGDLYSFKPDVDPWPKDPVPE